VLEKLMDIAVLRNENERLKEQLARTLAALAESEEARQRLETIIVDMRREKFGAKSEKLRPDQFHLPLEDVEIAQCEWRVHSPQKRRLKIPQFL
jgi:transposase